MLTAWLNDWRIVALAGAAILLLAVGAGWAIHRRRASVQRRALATLNAIADRLLLDVVLPDGIGGHVPVDALLLRDRTLYVLDIRDVEGAVFGSEKMDIWTAMSRKGRYQFNNPLRPMHDRVAAVRALTPGLSIESRILFTSRGHFPKGRPAGVQLLEEFAQPLLRPNKPSQAPELPPDVAAAWDRFCETSGVTLPPARRSGW